MKQARKTRFDVVTIGAATRDVFVRSKQFENVPSDSAPDGYNACLPLGAKIPVEELVFETGGGATNAAVTFRRFGLKTSCVTRVGNDVGGKEIIAQLKKERIDTSGLKTDPKERTGYAIILLSGAGHRAILVARGASQDLEKNGFDLARMTSNWIYLTSVAGNEHLLRQIFVQAKKQLTRVAWNPGNAEIAVGLKKLLPFLLQTDILILNREEAAELSDCSPRDFACMFHTLGPIPRRVLVITDGAHGAYAHARGVTWHAPASKGKILNTTGAGDAFGSAFVASIAKKEDNERALQAGTLNASSVVRHMGAKAGILKRAPTKNECARIRIRQV